MTVKELIAHLQTFDPDLPVAYDIHSEHALLRRGDVSVLQLQPPRADGWVHRPWSGEPKLPTIPYVVFP